MLKTLIGAAGVALAVATPAQATRETPRYTSLTVFGDSLVDAGNIRAIGLGADPTQGYFMGRFTNGYDYTDRISLALFGTVTTPSLGANVGGTNFAYGGARASNTSAVPDFGEQLGLYNAYLREGHSVDRNGLYVLNFGGNDVFNAPADATAKAAFLQKAAKDYADGLQTLFDMGVRNVLLTGFPVLTDPASTAAEGYLTTELARVRMAGDASLFRFSYLDFFTRVNTNPGSLGLDPLRLDITCQGAGRVAIEGGCQGIFSFDGTHPTAAVQEALFRDIDRQFAITAAVPEPAAWGMMMLGLGVVGGALRRRRGAVRAAAV